MEDMLDRLGFPSIGHHRRFVTAIAIDAVGSGVFMPISILYFLATTHLSLVQIGAAISIASLIALPVGPVIGGVVDRVGAKRILLVGNLLQGLGFVAYLVVDSLPAVVAAVLVTTLGRTAFWGSYGNIVAAISSPGERERWFGFLGALRNLGFAVGGLASGVAISVGTVLAYDSVVAINAVSFAVAFFLLLAVPPAAAVHRRHQREGWGTVLRDRPYRLLWVVQLAYSTSMQILNIAIPVYATTVLGLPGWVTGAVFTINCVLIGFGQGLAVRAMTGRVRWRILALSNLVFAVSYVVLLGATRTSVAVGVVVVIAGSVIYTVGEVTGGPVTAALSAEAAPEHLRGRYLSLVQLAWNGSSTITPVSFAWLLDRGATPLWLVMLGVAVLGAAASVLLGRVMPLAAAPVTNRPLDDGGATDVEEGTEPLEV